MNILLIINYNSIDDIEIFFKYNIEAITLYDKIIIVDNNSNELSKQKLLETTKLQKKIEIVWNSLNSGYSGGLNCGINYINENYNYESISFSNFDVILSKNTVKCLIERIDKNNIHIAAPRMINYKGVILDSAWKKNTVFRSIIKNSLILSKLTRKANFYSKFSPETDVYAVQGSFFISTRKAIDFIYPIDERLFLYSVEDYISHKIHSNNMRVCIFGDLDYVHYHDYSTRKIKSEMYHFKLIFKDKRTFLKHIYKFNKLEMSLVTLSYWLFYIERLLVLIIKRKMLVKSHD